MQQLFASYGPAIGPTLAFILGIIALFIRDALDSRKQTRRMKRRFRLLVSLIEESPPPERFHPRVSEGGFMHADEARNMTNLTRFYNRLTATKSLLRAVEDEVFRFGSTSEIRNYNHVRWLHEILLESVEDARQSGRVDLMSFGRITERYSRLRDATSSNAEENVSYIQ